MASYANLKAAIQQVIRTNGNQEITGALLQQSLLSMINSLGGYYQFVGIATPETNPGTPDQQVFYIGSAGTYPNFGPAVIPDGNLAVFYYDTNWHYGSVAFPLGDGAVTTSKIQDGAVTDDKLSNGVKEQIVHPVNVDDAANTDLDIGDENGNALVRFADGHIETKRFNSRGVNEKLNTIEEGAEVNTVNVIDADNGDCAIADENGRILVLFKDGHIKTKNFDSQKELGTRIRILAIGNSWTCDAYNYVGELLKNVFGDTVRTRIGVAYQGGASLQNHYNNLVNNSSYTYYEWVNTGPSWTKTTKAINTILQLDEWDVIVFQQVSTNSADYSTYQPYLNNCLDLISQRVSKPVKFGWNLVRRTMTTTVDWSNISDNAQRLLRETLIQFVIPCGTATENARTTSLDNLGDGGHLTYDGSHLQDGLPCLIEAYAVTLSFLSIFGYGQKGINGASFLPTQSWTNSHGMPDQANGSVIGLTDSNVVLAKKCATIAVNNPFVITDCSNL